MIVMALNEKHKYLSNFDYVSLRFNVFFGLLDYNYNHLDVLKRNFDLGATI
jgi:hypothetical protein